MRLGVVILAAGSGRRLGARANKVLLDLAGKPVLWYSLERFAHWAPVTSITVVIRPGDRAQVEHLLQQSPLPRPILLVSGGPKRQDSSLCGVRATDCDFVMVHDAARPFLSLRLAEHLFREAQRHGGAIPVRAIRESVKRVGEDGLIAADISRAGLCTAQTPQCFDYATLKSALERACASGREFTDEAAAVTAFAGVMPKVIAGEETNLKITTAYDLQLAECLARKGQLER